ncbi:MAG: O-antigen ligase family protein [Gracilibacteraceae bacterium]|nr:O-antigen ligase family protein [Gracilibacteraceae bacterium]
MSKKKAKHRAGPAAGKPSPAAGKPSPAAGKPSLAAGKSSPAWGLNPALMLAGAGVLLFFLIALIGSFDAAVEKGVALAAALALLGLCAATRTGFFRRLLTPTALPLTIYILLAGASTLYAVAGKFAISEFAKLFTAFALYALIVCRFTPGAPAVRRLCTALAAVGAVFSLISIDAASAGFITKIFRAATGVFTSAYANAGSVLAGARITSIFNTPNIFGGVAGLSLLLSLYLTATAPGRGEKRCQTVFLAVTTLAFLFTFSMGATLCLAAAAVVMLVAAAPPLRLRFLVLLLETLLAGLIVMYFTFDFLGAVGAAAWLPVAGTVAACLLLLLGERFVGEPLAAFLSRNSRAALIAGAALAALLLLLAALAANLAGPAQLAPGETLRRAAYPEPGRHTLTLQTTAPLDLLIETQNMEEVMMHKETVLYAGPAGDGEAIPFTVPEGSRVVWFSFTLPAGGPTDADLSGADWDGRPLKLRYTLLPASIANRLQGLWANQNAIQRFVFFSDGWKIFARRPLVGLGLGGYENAIFSVQDFYYTTKYAHNHYIQILAELGLLGFLSYLAFLGCAIRALWRSFRAKTEPAFTALLAAAFVMIVAHSAVEVVMSAGAFLPYAFAVFALITLHCDLPSPAAAAPKGKTRPDSPYPLATRIGLGAFALLFTVLLLGNFWARSLLTRAQNDTANFFTYMEQAAQIDAFEKNDYLLSYVINAPQTQNPEVIARADDFARRLARAKSNTIQGRLTEYYFTVGNPAEAFEMSRQILTYRRADPAIWSQQFTLIAAWQGSVVASGAMSQEEYAAAVLGIYELLLQANETRMESIALTEENLSFLHELGLI